MIPASWFRRALLDWYDAEKRDLPWRRNTDFYPVWISEIMLQQTRVEAVTPYFLRFLEQFPDVHALARAEETRVLAAWSGLGYYSRARNLHRAAKAMASSAEPRDYASILALPGVGEYTAAAVTSIVLGEPRAAVDGNVMRVISRIANDAADIRAGETRRRFAEEAARLLDVRRPGDFNQAMMELGATVCTPKAPACGGCPVQRLCGARAAGTTAQLPVKLGGKAAREVALDVAVLAREGRVFLIERAATERRLAGFRELPAKKDLPGARFRAAGEFTHQIVNDRFRVRVWLTKLAPRAPAGAWIAVADLSSLPVTTTAKKALRLAGVL
ncbi:MAG TPA: A/G-specific adenine glycosylase [Bryobacteraceae bacterium]|jgi:A/G-specific adenine glycosylase|nr:A/G-specific adenine glycosylase [Bryobacteraceae bacterium]